MLSAILLGFAFALSLSSCRAHTGEVTHAGEATSGGQDVKLWPAVLADGREVTVVGTFGG